MIKILSTIILIYFILLPLLKALQYRLRGMSHSWGTQINRIISWGIPAAVDFTLIAYLWNFPLWLGPLCGFTAFLSVCEGHSSEQGNTFKQNLGMSAITTLMVVETIVPIYGLTAWDRIRISSIFDFVILFGLLGGVCYHYGYKIKSKLTFFGIDWCVPGDASWGELFTGAFVFGLVEATLGIIGWFQHVWN